jgi:nucleoside-diphosphate-sugar epimerase
MKIIVVGGTGTIGKAAVVAELAKRHTVVVAGHTQGDVKVDIQDIKSIENMYKSINQFDAVVSTVGKVHFGEFVEMTPDQF